MKADERPGVVKRGIGIDLELLSRRHARLGPLRRDGASVRHAGQQRHRAVGFLEQAEQAGQRTAQRGALLDPEQRGERGRHVGQRKTGVDVEFVT